MYNIYALRGTNAFMSWKPGKVNFIKKGWGRERKRERKRQRLGKLGTIWKCQSTYILKNGTLFILNIKIAFFIVYDVYVERLTDTKSKSHRYNFYN